MPPKNPTGKKTSFDLSLLFLIFSNLSTIYFAITEDWNLIMVMWVYLFQSVTIGFFNFIRIIQYKYSSFITNKYDKQSVNQVAFFFLAHYGGFHFLYTITLATIASNNSLAQPLTSTQFKSISLMSFLFFINHFFSKIYNKTTFTKKQGVESLMFYPYARIIPMHAIMMINFTFKELALPLFLSLKTIADVIMHIVEHRIIRPSQN